MNDTSPDAGVIADLPGVEHGFLTNVGPGRYLARRLMLAKMDHLSHGAICVIDRENGSRRVLGQATGEAPISVWVEDARFYPKVLFGGSIGAAEAYMAGLWHTDNLVGVVGLLLRNRRALEGLDSGWAWLGKPVHWLAQRLRANTRAGSRRNIAAHYDLSNDFFRLWLDRRMLYSAGLFECLPASDESLEAAQVRKMDRLCRKLELGADDHLLEIGTGWGGFAIHAALTTGCRVTTTTISRRQYDLAVANIQRHGVADRVRVLLSDYRDLSGKFDKLVSIEMVEAVGHEHLDTYFRVCADRLVAGGRMALQGITIADRLYPSYRRSVDFIQRYVFPGSALLSVGSMTGAVAATDLQIVHLEDFGPHYAETLRHWRRRFVSQLDAIRGLGFGDRFIRLWEFYLAYCEAGFDERSISDLQVVLTKPGDRRACLLGDLGNLETTT